MLNLKEADVTQTRFYREVIEIGRLEGRQEGRQEGRLEGEANTIARILSRRFGSLSAELIQQVRSLSSAELESLSDALLDVQTIADLEAWLKERQPEK